jgi:hypothetical protein
VNFVEQNMSQNKDALNALTEQVITEIRKRMQTVNELSFGEITFYIRNNKLTRWVISESYLPENERERE